MVLTGYNFLVWIIILTVFGADNRIKLCLSMFLPQESFGFILFAISKPGINALSQGALADPVWGEVLGEGDGQFFPLRLTRQ